MDKILSDDEAPAQAPRGECFTNGNICARCGHPEFIEAQAMPAAWVEAVKVAREALELAHRLGKHGLYRDELVQIEDALAQLDALGGGECQHHYVRDIEHPLHHCCQKCGHVTKEQS